MDKIVLTKEQQSIFLKHFSNSDSAYLTDSEYQSLRTGHNLISFNGIRNKNNEILVFLTNNGIYYREMFSNEQSKRHTETIRYWITTSISILALIISIIALFISMN